MFRVKRPANRSKSKRWIVPGKIRERRIPEDKITRKATTTYLNLKEIIIKEKINKMENPAISLCVIKVRIRKSRIKGRFFLRQNSIKKKKKTKAIKFLGKCTAKKTIEGLKSAARAIKTEFHLLPVIWSDNK